MIVSGQLELAGLENLGSLPVSDLFEGRVVNVLGTIYIYSSGQWIAQAAGSQSLPAMNVGTIGLILSNDGTSPVWQEQYPTFDSGKFLQSTGSGVAWADPPASLPTQTGHAGEYLQTDGTSVSWEAVSAVPDQTGAAGKYLQSDGTVATWEDVSEVPDQTGASGKYLKSNGTVASWDALDDSDMPTGINANKIADGSVSNTEFQYINSLTSNAQTQITQNASDIATNTAAISSLNSTKQNADADLTALSALATTGIAARTAASTWATRTLTGTANRIVIADGDGVAGNPTFDIGSDVALKSLTLAQFAATTSLQLLGVISDETGTGSLVFGTSPTLATPVINGNPTGTFVVGIPNGGTGQTSKTPAFDALSPTTTKGDLIVYDGTDNIRRAVGADGTVLTADSSQASGLNWTSPLTNPMTTLGDIIYENASPAATRLPGNTTVQPQFLRQIGTGAISAVPAWANLLTSYVSGLNAAQATAHSLTFLSPVDIYITSPASAINQDLPSTNVLAGQYYRLIVAGATTANTVTLRSSGGNNIDVIAGAGFILVQALQNTPTTAAHWKLLDVYEEISFTSTFTFNGSGGTSSAATIKAVRHNARITTRIGGVTATTGTSSTAFNSNTDLPGRFAPAADRNFFCYSYNNGALITVPGVMAVQSNGNMVQSRDILSTAWTNSAQAGFIEVILTYDNL